MIMQVKMQRTFYPIGQGAFYGEHFDFGINSFNMVYDCGSAKNVKTEQSRAVIDQVVQNFYPNQDIDILFISHFDDDHVNKIHLLKKNRVIKRVVMPLLREDHKTFLIQINNILGNNEVVNLLENPQEFFGSETQLTYIKPVTENNTRENEEISEYEINSLNNNLPTEISSGTKLNVTEYNEKVWVYVPYNYEFTSRSQTFKNLLIQSNINLDKIKISEGDNNEIKKIRAIYHKVNGRVFINENSLLLFSNTYNKFRVYGRYWNCIPQYPWSCVCGCIYTGDATLSKISNDRNFFNLTDSNYYHKIGTIQVAHHGAFDSFDIDFFKNIEKQHPLFCPISFGLFNRYGHPANNVLQQLLNEHYIPIMVTEKKDSIFIQTYILEIYRNNSGSLKTYPPYF